MLPALAKKFYKTNGPFKAAIRLVDCTCAQLVQALIVLIQPYSALFKPSNFIIL